MLSNQLLLCNVAHSTSLPGIPPFLMLVTFYPRYKTEHRKWTGGIPSVYNPHNPKERLKGGKSLKLGSVFCRPCSTLWGWCWHWCGWCVFSMVLVACLSCSQVCQRLTDVKCSFIGSHYSWLPRISHTLIAPFASSSTHSSLSAVIHRL